MMKRNKKHQEAKEAKPKNKFQQLMQQLLVRIGIAVAVVGALAGLMLLATSTEESTQKERDKAKSELSTVRNKTSSLNKQIEDLGAASQIYADLAEERSNMEFVIQPKSVRDLMGQLKDAYFITTLNLELSNQETVDLSQLNQDEEEAVKIEGTMNLGGLSDQYIYQFIEALHQDFPGFVAMKSLSLQRRQSINIDVLSQISRGNPIETVSGNVAFNWYGFIRKKVEEENKPSETSDGGV
jgi:gas vesicle protein